MIFTLSYSGPWPTSFLAIWTVPPEVVTLVVVVVDVLDLVTLLLVWLDEPQPISGGFA